MEDRLLLTAIFWNTASDGFWDDAANWSPQQVPTANDDVTINPAGMLTITVANNAFVANSISLPGDDHLAMTSGTLTIGAASSIAHLDFSGGSITANGLLTLTDASTFSGSPALFGLWRNDGPLAVSGTPRIFNGAVLSNAGSIVSMGTFNIQTGGTLNNLAGGTFDVAFVGDFSFVSGGGTFHNEGTLKRSAAGIADNSGTVFENEAGGALVVTAGRFALRTNGSLAGADFTVATGTSVDFTGGNEVLALSGNLTGSGAGSVNFSSGILQSNNATLNFPAGLLHLGGATILGTLNNAGTMAVGFTPVIPNGAVLNNAGSIVSMGTFNIQPGGTLNNLAGGTLDVAFVGDFSFVSAAVGGGTFHNEGTLKRSAAGIANNSGIFFENEAGGALVVTAGSFALQTNGSLDGAVFTVAAGSSVDFSGPNGIELALSGTLTGTGAGSVNFSSGNIRPNNATLNFPAGLLNWNGGNILGPLNNVGTMAVGGSPLIATGSVVNNSGTIVETGGFNIQGGGTLNNLAGGTLDVAFNGDGLFVFGAGLFHNAGTLKRSAAGAAGNGGVFLQNDSGGAFVLTAGSFALATNGSLDGAVFTVAAGSSVDFSGPNGIELALSGTLTGTGAGSVNFSSGNIRPNNATLNFPAGLLNWNGGNILGPLNNVGTMAVGGSPLIATGSVVNNSGTIVEAGGFNIQGGGTLNNLAGGTLDVAFSGDGLFIFGAGLFHNAGTLKRSAAGAANNGGTFFENEAGGSFVLTAGSFALATNGALAGGTFTVAAGTSVDFSGPNGIELALSGKYTGSGAGTVSISSGNVRPNNATFDFPAGLFHFFGGNLLGPLNNAGFITIDAQPNLAAGVELNNLAGATITVALPGSDLFLAGSGVLKNAGALRHTGTGTASLSAVQFQNLSGGLVDVQSGTLNLGAVQNLASGTLTGGAWRVGANATLQVTGAITTNAADIALDGLGSTLAAVNGLTTNNGTLRLLNDRDFTTTGAFLNNGTLVVGAKSVFTAASTLTETASAVLMFEIGGTPASGNFGKIAVTGAAALNGTAALAFTNGYAPAIGHVFPLMTFASQSGALGDGTGFFFQRTRVFNSQTSATSYQITAIADASDLDAAVILTPGSATSGQNVTVDFKVTNISATPTFASAWTDSVFLSLNDKLDPSDKLIGRVPHDGALAGGAFYNGSLTAPLPGVLPGQYRFLVVTDSAGQMPDKDRTNNVEASTAVTADIPTLTPGVAVNGTIANGQDVFYRIDLPAGETPVFSANYGANGAAELYIGQLFVPGPIAYDVLQFSPDSADAKITGFAPLEGTYYILLRGRENAGGGSAFTLSADSLGFGIASIDANRGANVGTLTTTVHGSLFRPETTFSLVPGAGAPIPAQRVYFQDSSTDFVTFDLTGLPVGDYGVRAQQGAALETLPNAVHVVTGTAGTFEFNLSAPRYIRAPFFNVFTTLTYENTGDTDLIAPIVTLTGENGTFSLVGEQGGQRGSIEILAINPTGPAGILPPGAKGQLLVQFVPINAEPHQFVIFTARVAGPADLVVDWSLLKDDLRPASVAADAWDAIYGNFETQLGTTFTQYQSDNATYLSLLGHRTADVGELVGYELLQAGDFGSISQRYELGTLGRGQTAPFDVRAITAPPSQTLPPNFTPRQEPAFIINDDQITVTFSRFAFSGSSGGGGGGGQVFRSPPPPPVPSLDDLAGVEGNVTIQIGDEIRSFISIGDGVSLNKGQFIGVPGETGTLLRLASGALKLTELDGFVTMFRASDGRIDFTEDTNGQRVTAGYDVDGRLTALTETDGDVTSFSYNAQGRITQIADSVGRMTSFTYDASGEHLLTQTNPTGTTSFTYVSGQGAAREHALASQTFPDGTKTTYNYDVQGRLTSQERDGGAEKLTYSYDSAGTAAETDLQGNTTTLFRDNNGQAARLVDALGRIAISTFDDQGKLTSAITPGGIGNFVSYDFNGIVNGLVNPAGDAVRLENGGAFHRLTALTDTRGNSTQFGYDARGNITSITDGLGGTATYGFDAAGHLTQTTNVRGQVITYTYDAKSLVILKDLPGTADDVTFTYDAHRNLDTATSPADGTTNYDYDTADRLMKATYPNGKFVAYTYDAAGRRTSTSDQSGFTVNYLYDALGRPDRVTDTSNATLTDYDYDALGRVASEKHGNNSTTSYGYDALGRVTTITHTAADNVTVLESFTYTYDAAGRIVSQTSSVSGTTTYGYDIKGQLTSAQLPGGRAITYAYDSEGNRTVVADTAAGTTNYAAANELNQYTTAGGATYSYDADGNLVARVGGANGNASYTYDVESRLIAAVTPDGTFTYDYDAANNRISMTKNGVRTDFLIDATGLGNVFAEYGAGGALTAHYAQGLGLASRVDAGGQAAFYHYDLTGNTQLLTGASGAVLNTYEYLPFGEKVGSTGTLANSFTFNAQLGVQENGAGLYDMRARVYDPSLGRFLQKDPIGINSGETNTYRYALNSPVQYGDPSGLLVGLGPLETLFLETTGTFLTELEAPVFAARVARGHFATRAAITSAEVAFAGEASAGGSTLITPTKNPRFLSNVVKVARNLAAGEVFGLGLFFASSGAVIGTAANQASDYFYPDQKDTFRQTLSDGFNLNPGLDQPLVDKSGLNNARYNPLVRDSLDDPLVNDVAKTLIRDFGLTPEEALLEARRLVKNFRRSASEVIAPNDPNNIIGPNGVGADPLLDVGAQPVRFDGFVKADGNFGYTIQFENKPTASAPAQVVQITQTLDSDLDLSTFQLGSFTFGNLQVEVPTGLSSYHTVIDASATLGVLVDVSAGLNLQTGVATWTFASLDPQTGDLPTDPFAGFLPANVTAPEGDGSVTYSVAPMPGLANGTDFTALASIVFDTETAIATPTVTNTLDTVAPTSSVDSLPATTFATAGRFTVSWSGSDDTSGVAGSGVAYFDVFVSDNGGPFTAFQQETSAMSATFTGQFGHTYGFFSVATDKVGERQPTPAAAQAVTTLEAEDPGPNVTDARINANATGKAIANIVLTFDEALTPATANNPASFMLDTAGKDKRFGTRDDVTLNVATAVYDDALRTVTLTAQSRKPLKLNQLIRVTAKGTGGVTNLGGAALDGDANSAPGGDFVRSLGLGTKLSFPDPTGDVVALTLKKGGLIELSLPTTGDPTVRLTGTVAGTSTLTGTVKKPKTGAGDGRATIASITGAAGVNTTELVRCSPTVTTNCLTIGSISASVVDRILESEDPQVAL